MALQKIPGRAIQLVSQSHGDIMYFNGTDWVNLPVGADGQYLKSNGPGISPSWAAVASTGTTEGTSYTFDADVLWTIPTGITNLKLELVGGGGNGGDGHGSGNCDTDGTSTGGGGGSGGYAKVNTFAVGSETTLQILVGKENTIDSSGDSSIRLGSNTATVIISAAGGGNGSTVWPCGGGQGAGGGGGSVFTGSEAAGAVKTNGNGGSGSTGGTSFWGSGIGNGGGGGSCSWTSVTQGSGWVGSPNPGPGGAGSPGRVIITSLV
jgi:hypothetical protein